MLGLFVWLQPATASADWLITPYAGWKFAGDSNIVNAQRGAGATKFMLGGSLTLLGDGILGVEADFGYVPRFFERETVDPLIVSSSVTTVTGNVILAAPRSVTRESLRPYALGGVGLMHVGIEDLLGIHQVETNLFCLTLGGGAIGAITPTTSLRFELRHFRNLTPEGESASFGSRLSFWRATVGVTLRY